MGCTAGLIKMTGERPVMDYEQFKLADFTHWAAYLHVSQNYLGRLYLAAKRDGDIDFLDMRVEEQSDFFESGGKVKRALDDLFQPDRLNYASLQNEWPHLHVHVIPRYASPRTFDGITFTDERWGKNYAPYDKSFTVPEATLFRIRDELAARLSHS